MVDQELIRICRVKDNINALLTGIDMLDKYPEIMNECIIPILRMMSFPEEEILKRVELIKLDKETAKTSIREELIRRNAIEGVYFPTKDVVRTLALINFIRPNEDNLNNYLRAIKASGYTYDIETNVCLGFSTYKAYLHETESDVKQKKLV